MKKAPLNPEIVNCRHILLLGAGASAPLGLKPTAPFLGYLPERLIQVVRSSRPAGISDMVFKSALEELFAFAAKHHKMSSPDCEVVLDYLDYLAEMSDDLHRLSPAFAELANTKGGSDFHQRWGVWFRELSGYIKRVVVEHYSEVDGVQAMVLYRPVFRMMCGIGGLLPVFTTNYDWSFEHLADAGEEHVHVVDGFARKSLGEQWQRSAFLDLRRETEKFNIALFKLHGSTSWYRDARSPTVIRKFAAAAPELAGSRAVVIYPMQVKAAATEEEPFRTAYDYLRESFMNARLAVIIGFSFRDPAITAVMSDAMSKNESLKLVIVEPSMGEDPGVPLSRVESALGIDSLKRESRVRIVKAHFGGEVVAGAVQESVQKLDDWDSLKRWVT